MKKILAFLVAILLLNFLMAVGLVGYVVATGRLDGAKMRTILDLVRRPGTPVGLREKVAEIVAPTGKAAVAATQAVEEGVKTLEGAAVSVAASASERIAYAQQAIEQERLRLDREVQDLQQRQKLLEVQRHELDTKLAEIEAKQKNFDAQVAAATARLKKESFAKTLAMYSELKPKQVKEIFLGLDPQTVVDYLTAMEGEQATKVMGEFKSPAEQAFIGKILERIRADGIGPAKDSGGAGAAGTTVPAAVSQARN